MRFRLKMISKTRSWSRHIILSVAVAMLPGACASASSDKWPNLAEGFETWIVSDIEPGANADSSGEKLPPPAADSRAARERVAELQSELDALVAALTSQHQTYREARDIAEQADGVENATRQWLSAQLELSRLSQLADGFAALERKLTNPGSPELRALQVQVTEQGAALRELIDEEQLSLGSRAPS